MRGHTIHSTNYLADFNSRLTKFRTHRAGRLSSLTTSLKGPDFASSGCPLMVLATMTSPGWKGIDFRERALGGCGADALRAFEVFVFGLPCFTPAAKFERNGHTGIAEIIRGGAIGHGASYHHSTHA